MDMKHTRRSFLQTASAAGVAAAVGNVGAAVEHSSLDQGVRRFHCVQIDVFTSRRLEGNPLAVFTDARGLSDSEMQDLARETNLQETTFVLPRDPATEREQGIKVRIFVPDEEIPFGGHPTLGTAMVLRNLRMARADSRVDHAKDGSSVLLDLKVGKVPVDFREDASRRYLEKCIRSSLCLDQSMIETRSRLSLICRRAIFPATHRSSLSLRACSSSLCRSRICPRFGG